MTTSEDELQALRRIEAKVDGVDARLRAVETNVATLTAVDAVRQEHEERLADSRRWLVGLSLTAGVAIAGLLMALADRIGG